MASPRIKRLTSDHRKVLERFKTSGLIEVTPVGANQPPNKYHVLYRVKGLEAEGKERDTHKVELHLDLDYPKKGPKAKMLTPIFHPNINPTRICYGDHWTPQETLDALIIRIGEMIAYQSFFTKSPLDGAAARWTELNLERFPLDARDLFPSAEIRPLEQERPPKKAETKVSHSKGVEGVPVITLKGQPVVRIEAGSEYRDEGVSALDANGRDISGWVTSTGIGFDTSIPGTYTIRYNVRGGNGTGNAAAEVTRIVHVDAPLEVRILGEGERTQKTSLNKESINEIGEKSKTTERVLEVYLWYSDEWQGPHSVNQIQQWLDEQRIYRDDYVHFTGCSKGTRVWQIPGIKCPPPDDFQSIKEELMELETLFKSRVAALQERLNRLEGKVTSSPQSRKTENVDTLLASAGVKEVILYDQGKNVTVTPRELANRLDEGQVSLKDFILYEGMVEWRTIGDCVVKLGRTTE